jgi:hypothetical protein
MTTREKTALRARHYTYYEVLAFAQFYQQHRNENSPENLLRAYLQWQQVEGEFTPMARKLLTIEEVVCKYYALTLVDVRGKRRYTEFVRARQVIAYESVKLTSQHKAADTLGGNRNNIQFGKTKCAILMETEPLLRKEVKEIEQRLVEPFAKIDADFEEQKRKTINEALKETTNEETTNCEQRAAGT